MRIKLVIFFLLFAVFGFANDSTQRQNAIVEKLVNTDHASDADGARIEKKEMTAVDYVPEIHGTVRAIRCESFSSAQRTIFCYRQCSPNGSIQSRS